MRHGPLLVFALHEHSPPPPCPKAAVGGRPEEMREEEEPLGGKELLIRSEHLINNSPPAAPCPTEMSWCEENQIQTNPYLIHLYKPLRSLLMTTHL